MAFGHVPDRAIAEGGALSRIRSYRPTFWTWAEVVECSPLARLFYLGLATEADDNGVFKWRPSNLRLRLLPGDQADGAALLGELADAGLVRRYEVAGAGYGHLRWFHMIQKPKAPQFKHPVPEELPEGYTLHSAYRARRGGGGRGVSGVPQEFPSSGECVGKSWGTGVGVGVGDLKTPLSPPASGGNDAVESGGVAGGGGDAGKGDSPRASLRSLGTVPISSVSSDAAQQELRPAQEFRHAGAGKRRVRDAETVDPEEFMLAWNAFAETEIGQLRGVIPMRCLNDTRRRAIRSRSRDPSWRAGWREALTRLESVLQDSSSRWMWKGYGNRPQWSVCQEWFCRGDTVAKILEGAFDGGGGETAELSCCAAQTGGMFG